MLINNETIVNIDNQNIVRGYIFELCINNDLDSLNLLSDVVDQLEPGDFVNEAILCGHDDVALFWLNRKRHIEYVRQFAQFFLYYCISDNHSDRSFHSPLLQKLLSYTDAMDDAFFIAMQNDVQSGAIVITCSDLKAWFNEQLLSRNLTASSDH